MHKYISLIAAVSTVTQALPSFKLMGTMTALEEANGTTESCSFDYTNDRWIMFDREPWNGVVDSLSSTYPDRNVIDEFAISVNTDSDGLYDGALGTVYIESQAAIYFADDEGSVKKYDLNSNSITDTIIIIPTTPGTNGLCYDSDTNTIYATNIGLDFANNVYIDADAGIWKIEIGNSNTITRVYTGGDAVDDQENNIKKNSDDSNYVFHPNGCAASNGMLYFVETRIDGSGALGILTAGTDILSIDTSKGTTSGDGLIFIADYLIMSSWHGGTDNSGALLYADTKGSFTFTIGIQGLTSPADIAVGPLNTICVPSLTTGHMYFIRFFPRTTLRKLSREFVQVEPETNTPARSQNLVFDPIRKKYAYTNQHAADSSNIPDLHEISTDWAADETGTITDNGLLGSDHKLESVIPTRSTSCCGDISPLTLGATIANDLFYGVDAYGMLWVQDLTTEHITNYVDVGDYVNNYEQGGVKYFDGWVGGASGVCIDPQHTHMAYVVNRYTGGIYQVDVGQEIWSKTDLYTGELIYDQDGLNPVIYKPQQCTIMDGNIYMVSRTQAGLGIYNIENGSFIYDTKILTTTGQTIGMVNGIFIIVQVDLDFEKGNPGVDRVGYDIWIPNEDETAQIQFYDFVTHLGFPWQVAIDYFNGVVAFVQDDEGKDYEGVITFFKHGDLIIPTTASPTSLAPTQYPSIAPSEGEHVVIDASSGDNESKAYHNSINIVYIIILIICVAHYNTH